jgi:hypothetical protein
VVTDGSAADLTIEVMGQEHHRRVRPCRSCSSLPLS